MGTKAFFTKSWPTRLGYYTAKWAPPFLGRMIVGLLARVAIYLKPDVYWASLDNFSHIYKNISTHELQQYVYRQYYNTLRCYYELFHNIGRGRTQVQHFKPPVRISPETMTYINDSLASGRGLLIIACHMANFDLGGIGLSQYLPTPIQALSLASPAPGFEFFNQLRAIGHGIITPINAQTLREAIVRLKKGGVVLTGADRPIGEGDKPVTFFGETAYLPTGYIRIALLTDCLVMTTSFFYENNEYWIESNEPMEMIRTGHRDSDVKVNVDRILVQVENFIKRDPTQWMMFLRVWPEKEAG